MRRAALTVVSPLVILDIEHITTRNVGRKAAFVVNDWLLRQERTGRLAVADASADTLRTLDRRDFKAITPLTGSHAFRLLPDDL